MKKKSWDEHIIGYDIGEENGLNYDVAIGNFGNPIVAIKIKNLVEQYSSDKDEYLKYQGALQNLLSIIGEGHVFQKSDIIVKKIYKGEQNDEYLQQTYSDHFEGREYKVIETFISFTHIIDKDKGKSGYVYSDKKYSDLLERCSKIFMLLNQNGFNPIYFKEADFERHISCYSSMNYTDKDPISNNIASFPELLKIGKQRVKTISFVDVENIELPNYISPFTELGGKSATKDTPVDNFTFLNDLTYYNTIIYNQVVVLPDQKKRIKLLNNKKNKHEGFIKEPANRIASEEIDLLLENIEIDGEMIVDAHFSLIIACDTDSDLETTVSMIQTKLFSKSIKTSEDAYNQLELFRAGLIGNATELKEYDLFTTTSEASLCFFFKESYPVDEESQFYLRFTDRQGVPLKIDTSDLPMATNRISNRNKFVLGPSGTGKSFLMNNIIEQYLNYNYDVVIVDTGDSYSGTCKYFGGKYIQYTEENPITMNPFLLDKSEFNIEKVDFLQNLIFLIWKGADGVMSTTVKTVLENLILSYYDQFFNKNTNWFENKKNEDLILFLRKFNIHREDINEAFEDEWNESGNYYSVLGITMKASDVEIKKAFKRLASIYHPDKNQGDEGHTDDEFVKVYEAYSVLSNEKKRRKYDLTQVRVVNHEVVERPKKNTEKWDEAFRHSLIKTIKEVDERFFVESLSFNSFYEYAEEFLPVYLNNKKHNLSEEEFNLTTFTYVLSNFYKGGIYDKTLNESADNNLFTERMIVFEIDNVKDNKTLFPIVTLIIMDTFIQKMRLRKDQRKALIIEEAWKAIASKLMGGYILYLYKTVRKFWGEAVVVTQELDDILNNAVVKDSIINNSDTFILLDQTKFIDNFDNVAKLLSLNKVEQRKIFTINNLDNKAKRARFKEFYLRRGSKGEVYGNEVSLHQYLTYTTEKPEKGAIDYYSVIYKGEEKEYELSLDHFIKDINVLSGDNNGVLGDLVSLVNLYHKPIDKDVIDYFRHMKNTYGNEVFKEIKKEMNRGNFTLQEIIDTKKIEEYEKV